MRTTDKYVLFWGGLYSQWYLADIVIDGTTFNCCEQYMMFKKAVLFGDDLTAEAIMRATDPKEQKALGRKVQDFNKEVWEQHCRQYVYEANLAKFTQYPTFRKALLRTGKREIVEASPYDTIWGIGMHYNDSGVEDPNNWRGTNWLGEAIMQVRETIKTQNL